MKFIVTIFLLMSIVSVALGAVYRSNQIDPKNPNNCLVQGQSFAIGTHNNPSSTKCFRVECEKGGHSTVASCGAMARENCVKDGLVDVSRPYPTCCEPKWKCKK